MADSFGGQAGGLGGVIAAFGGSDKPPVPVLLPGAAGLLQRGANLARSTYGALQSGLDAFRNAYEQGTQRQLGLQNEQADILRGLTQRALNRDPLQQLKETGNTLFSFLDPNVINPAAAAAANRFRVHAMAQGINPDVANSTVQRIQDARNANSLRYNLARDIYGQIPNVYNQVRNAGITDEMLAAGYNPMIQAGYRAIDMAPLVPLQASVDLTNQGIDLSGRYGQNYRGNVYGYHKPMNLADRFGAAGQSLWNTVKDAAQIYASLYGGGIGGMAGGGATPTRPPATTLPASGLPPAGAPYYGYPAASAYA